MKTISTIFYMLLLSGTSLSGQELTHADTLRYYEQEAIWRVARRHRRLVMTQADTVYNDCVLAEIEETNNLSYTSSSCAIDWCRIEEPCI